VKTFPSKQKGKQKKRFQNQYRMRFFSSQATPQSYWRKIQMNDLVSIRLDSRFVIHRCWDTAKQKKEFAA
jgi:ribosomal protein L11 methylase PrmA